MQFDILDNPFVVLNVSPRATRADLVAAKENAVWDLGIDDGLAVKALSTLQHPRDRLLAEISFLPSASPAQCKAITAALRKGQLPDASGLSALDQANLLAHALSAGKAGLDAIEFLSRLHQQIDVTEVIREINANRQLSREKNVDRADVVASLNILVKRHAQVAAKFVASDASKHVDDYRSAASIRAAERLVKDDEDGKSAFVAGFIEAYGSLTRPELMRLSERIGSAMVELRTRPSIALAEKIADDVHQWDALRQPVQLWDVAHGIDEPESEALGKKLRELCIFLANDKRSFDIALIITKAMTEAFGELQGLSEKLEEDFETLEGLLEGQRIEQVAGPLNEAVEAARAKLASTAAAISRGSLTSRSNKNIARLVEQFAIAAASLVDTPQAGVPALIVRSLALSLHNEGGHSQAALTLTNWILATAPQLPRELQAKLEEDRDALNRILKQTALLDAANSGQHRRVEELASELAATTDDEEERAQLEHLALSAQKRRASNRMTNWLWGGIGAVVFFFMILDEDNSLSRDRAHVPQPTFDIDQSLPRSAAELDAAAATAAAADAPTTDIATVTDGAAAAAEEAATTVGASEALIASDAQLGNGGNEQVPSIGTGLVLTLAEIRYCRRQDARLTAASRLVDTSSQSEVDGFNAAVAQYNMRCSNFRYAQRDMDIVEQELVADASQLVREGIEMVEGWR